MTIVTWDGRYLAADSQTTEESIVCSTVTEKIFLGRQQSRVAYAGFGAAKLLGPMIAWLENGAPLDQIPFASEEDKACSAVIQVRGHSAQMFTISTPYPEVVYPGEAFGTNKQYARGIMACERTAIEAAFMTAAVSVYSGGPIRYVDTSEDLWQVRTYSPNLASERGV